MNNNVSYLAVFMIALDVCLIIYFAWQNDVQTRRQMVTESVSVPDLWNAAATEKPARRVHQPESLLLHPSELKSLHLPLFLRDIMPDPTEYNIYQVVTRLPRTLNLRYFCSLESYCLENPDATVWLLMLGMDSIEGNPLRLLEGMQRGYPNLQLASLDMMLTVKDTPLESIVTTGKLNQSDYPANHMSDVLRLALVSKAGGFYSDFDFICLRSVTSVRNSMMQALPNLVTNALFHFDAGHPFLQLMMVEDGINFRPNHWSWNGPLLFTRLQAEYCRGYHFKNHNNGKASLLNKIKSELRHQTTEPFPPKKSVKATSIASVHDPSMAEELCRSVAVLEPSTFMRVYANGIKKMFQNGSVDTLLDVPVESYALHLFNAVTNSHALVENSALHVVARRYCPQTHATVHNSSMTL